MVRTPVLAAGGIVLRQEGAPLIAVVRLRKRNEWVLPKGKLDEGETPRAAAEREVNEETGHDVSVHEFLGTLVYESGGRSKVVHYWRMEASLEPVHELMDDVKAVEWLPLEDAVERLSRGYERAFLENVGPIALSAAEFAGTAGRAKAEQPAPDRRRRGPDVAPPLSPIEPVPASSQGDLVSSQAEPEERAVAADDDVAAETSLHATESAIAASNALAIGPVVIEAAATSATEGGRKNLIQRVRDWLRA